MVEKILDFTEREKGNIVAFLRDLISIESITGGEEAVAKRAAAEMKKCGFDEVFYDSIGNVIGKIGSGRKILLYDAHVDTVGAEKNRWETDPFSPIERNGKIYGRGAVDDKGPFSCLVYAGKAMKALSLTGDYTVYVIGSVSEEDCEGLALASFLREYRLKPDYAVIAEASDLTICRGHRGRALIEAEFPGVPVHASIHHQGENPIEKALPFMQAVSELDKGFPLDGPLGRGDAAVTNVVCSSVSLNTLPSSCKVIIDRRLTSRDSKESVLREFKSLSGAERASIRFVQYREPSYTGHMKEAEEFFPGWVLDEDHEIIQGASRCFTRLFKKDPTVKVWGFSTNGNYTMGFEAIPTLGFGPGKENQAHADNEHVDIEQLFAAVSFYAGLPIFLGKD